MRLKEGDIIRVKGITETKKSETLLILERTDGDKTIHTAIYISDIGGRPLTAKQKAYARKLVKS